MCADTDALCSFVCTMEVISQRWSRDCNSLMLSQWILLFLFSSLSSGMNYFQKLFFFFFGKHSSMENNNLLLQSLKCTKETAQGFTSTSDQTRILHVLWTVFVMNQRKNTHPAKKNILIGNYETSCISYWRIMLALAGDCFCLLEWNRQKVSLL